MFLNETAIIFAFSVTNTENSLILAINVLDFLENTGVSQLFELGWAWLLLEVQYDEGSNPMKLRFHCIYREKYVLFEVELPQKSLNFEIFADSYFLSVGSSFVNTQFLCECSINVMRVYSPWFFQENAWDISDIWRLSANDLSIF